MKSYDPTEWDIEPEGYNPDEWDFAGVETPTAAPENVERRGVGGALKDVAITAGKGVVGLSEAAVGLADIPTLGRFGKGLESIGYDPKTTKEILGGFYTPAQKAAFKKVEESKGFIGKAKAMVKSPSTIGHAVIESAPSMLGGAAAARKIVASGVLKMTPVWDKILAAAIGEGAVSAGQMAESVRQQTKDGYLTPKQAAVSSISGAGTALISVISGRVAQKLGIADIDVFLAGERGVTSAGVAKRIIGGGISEGALEELPQSMQEQVWMNAALDKPLLENVGEAGAEGLLTGAAMGAGFNIFTGGKAPAEIVPPDLSPLIGLIEEGLSTGELDGEPFTPEIAKVMMDEAYADKVLTVEDVALLQEKFPELGTSFMPEGDAPIEPVEPKGPTDGPGTAPDAPFTPEERTYYPTPEEGKYPHLQKPTKPEEPGISDKDAAEFETEIREEQKEAGEFGRIREAAKRHVKEKNKPAEQSISEQADARYEEIKKKKGKKSQTEKDFVEYYEKVQARKAQIQDEIDAFDVEYEREEAVEDESEREARKFEEKSRAYVQEKNKAEEQNVSDQADAKYEKILKKKGKKTQAEKDFVEYYEKMQARKAAIQDEIDAFDVEYEGEEKVEVPEDKLEKEAKEFEEKSKAYVKEKNKSAEQSVSEQTDAKYEEIKKKKGRKSKTDKEFVEHYEKVQKRKAEVQDEIDAFNTAYDEEVPSAEEIRIPERKIPKDGVKPRAGKEARREDLRDIKESVEGRKAIEGPVGKRKIEPLKEVPSETKPAKDKIPEEPSKPKAKPSTQEIEDVKVSEDGAKEPWEISRAEYLKTNPEGLTGDLNLLGRRLGDKHENLVREAYERGETIPEKVLKDYPALTKVGDAVSRVGKKPRMAESADSLYKSIIKATDEGVVSGTRGGHRILYPAVAVIGRGHFKISSKGIEKITEKGVATREATKAEKEDVHDAIEKDQAEVLLMSGWGGGVKLKSVEILHSPSGNSFSKIPAKSKLKIDLTPAIEAARAREAKEAQRIEAAKPTDIKNIPADLKVKTKSYPDKITKQTEESLESTPDKAKGLLKAFNKTEALESENAREALTRIDEEIEQMKKVEACII